MRIERAGLYATLWPETLLHERFRLRRVYSMYAGACGRTTAAILV